jgi:hypothetical protein
MAKIKIKIGEPKDTVPQHVCIDKIDNGFIISGFDGDKETREFVKNLASAPSILARIFKLKGSKSGREIEDMTETEEE